MTEERAVPGPVRVLVVDDHPLVRAGLERFLAAQEGIAVAGEARSAGEAVVRGRTLDVDVILLDLGLPDAEGAAAVRLVADGLAGVKILVLTGLASPALARDCLRAGASGFLDKSAAPATILDGVQRVAAGDVVMDPALAAALLDVPVAALTVRELEVLGAIADGLTNRQVARLLGSSEHTVKTQLARVMEKLGAADRTQAVALSLRRGLLR